VTVSDAVGVRACVHHTWSPIYWALLANQKLPVRLFTRSAPHTPSRVFIYNEVRTQAHTQCKLLAASHYALPSHPLQSASCKCVNALMLTTSQTPALLTQHQTTEDD